MLRTFLLVLASAATLLPLHTVAQEKSAAGVWKTIDDHSGKVKALIRISEANGEYKGKIERLFRGPDEEQNPKCDKCEDARKDQPLIGMTVLSGMKPDQQEPGAYTGGQILDPENGKIYKSKMSLADDGKKLNVRGYIGLPLLGRTQTWVRSE